MKESKWANMAIKLLLVTAAFTTLLTGQPRAKKEGMTSDTDDMLSGWASDWN